jgi:AraC-like DNA-binding protein
MVCNRCKMAVKSELEKLDITPVSVELGEVELQQDLTPEQKQSFIRSLQALGFDWIDDKKSKTIERIKNIIVELIHHQNNQLKTNLSDHLSQQLGQDYNILSKLFSEVENTTIEQFVIAQKTEKVKELIMYDELSLSEIANKLNYSSIGHLSNQFKKVTGLTPSYYKQLKINKRNQIDEL